MQNTLKTTLFALAFLLGLSSFLAQNDLPKDPDTGLITYTEVVNQADGNKQELFRRLAIWVNKYYKNPKDAIKEQNTETQELLLVHRFKIFNIPEKGNKTDAGLVEYKLRIACKDGRYKYDLTNIQWKQTSSFPIEKWQDPKNTKSHPEYASYLKQVDEQVKLILADLKKAMSEAGGKANADW